jgi:hypothetical protein
LTKSVALNVLVDTLRKRLLSAAFRTGRNALAAFGDTTGEASE